MTSCLDCLRSFIPSLPFLNVDLPAAETVFKNGIANYNSQKVTLRDCIDVCISSVKDHLKEADGDVIEKCREMLQNFDEEASNDGVLKKGFKGKFVELVAETWSNKAAKKFLIVLNHQDKEKQGVAAEIWSKQFLEAAAFCCELKEGNAYQDLLMQKMQAAFELQFMTAMEQRLLRILAKVEHRFSLSPADREFASKPAESVRPEVNENKSFLYAVCKKAIEIRDSNVTDHESKVQMFRDVLQAKKDK